MRVKITEDGNGVPWLGIAFAVAAVCISFDMVVWMAIVLGLVVSTVIAVVRAVSGK